GRARPVRARGVGTDAARKLPGDDVRDQCLRLRADRLPDGRVHRVASAPGAAPVVPGRRRARRLHDVLAARARGSAAARVPGRRHRRALSGRHRGGGDHRGGHGDGGDPLADPARPSPEVGMTAGTTLTAGSTLAAGTTLTAESALLVLIGGMLGAPARYLLDRWVRSMIRTTFPWGTWVVNVTGSALLGFLAAGPFPSWVMAG